MIFREVPLTDKNIALLIAFSRDWEAENSCYGYVANTPETFAGNRVFMAYDGDRAIGYLYGHVFAAERIRSIIPDGAKCFEVEELYIAPAYRSRGIDAQLFSFAENAVKFDADYLILSTATKNWKAILHFYIAEVHMTF